ncbi:MAG: site-specific DNA-methyltransferase [Candidatus Marinimicrobia bacterium]|nr:site-specific DNA-methyltransferase [Candidatus Neomarinimicrobiota bacterium]
MTSKYEPQIIYGDFFQEYKNHLDPRSVDLFLSDPPWGLFQEDSDLTGVSDPEINIEKLEDVLDYLLCKNGTVLIFCDLDLLIRLKTSFNKFIFKWNYVLNKTLSVPEGKYRPIPTVEYISVFHRAETRTSEIPFNGYESGRKGLPYQKKNYPDYQEQKTRRKIKNDFDLNKSGKRWIRQSLNMRNRCNLLKIERELGGGHPFQKSERLLRILIKVHSKPGALVLDGFTGSGSTLVAASKEGRKSIGLENDKRWLEVCKDRIKHETSKIEVFQ